MNLLQSVNKILPYLGQRTATDIDSPHPTVAKVRGLIDDARLELLNRSWWFSERTVNLLPNIDGLIARPNSVVAVYPIGNVDLLEFRGGYLFNLAQNTQVFSAAVPVVLRDDLVFEDLPSTAQSVVTWQAAVSAYLSIFEGGTVPQKLSNDASRAQAALEAEHLRKQNYNTYRLPAVSRLRALLGGS